MKPLLHFAIFGSILLFHCFPLDAQTIIVNEMVTSNSLYLDEDGDTPDWFELRNTSTSEVDLTGWTVTDDLDDTDRWTFPQIVLSPDAYFKIWASDKDRTTYSSTRTIIRPEDEFRYLVPNVPVIDAWRGLDFDDNSWSIGTAGFGYGDGDDATELPSGTRSVYVRKTFTITDPSQVTDLLLHVDFDDGFVAYLNGTEIARANINGNPPAYNALALSDQEAQVHAGSSPEFFPIAAPADLLQAGDNVLAIQVHNKNSSSSDLSLLPWLTIVLDVPSDLGVPPPSLLKVFNLCPHTNFKLSPGETLYLYDDQGIYVDSLLSGEVPADLAFGRLPNQPFERRLFTHPTPVAVNPDIGLLGALEPKINFSVTGGPLPSATTLILSGVDAPGVIRFTLDATPPTATSEVYSSPISIDDNTVVRAAVFRDNYLPSRVQTETYLLNATHELPVISLVTTPENFFDNDSGIYVFGDEYESSVPYFGANFWEEWERPIHFSFYEPDGTLGIALDAGVKIFGNYSRIHAQRSLAIFARDRYGTSEIDYPFFPHLPYQKFQAIALRNSGNDFLRSNFRDGTITSLLRDADLETQAYRPCVVYLNGEYWGMYNLREKVNEHYLNSRHDIDPDKVDLLQARATNPLQGDNTAYLDLLQFVETNDLSITSNFVQVEEQIDIDNYILYYVSQIYVNNTDWPGNNIKFWSSEGSKWRWILFDTDFGLGAWSGNAYQSNTIAFALATNGPGWPNPPWSTLLFRNLLENISFRNRFVNRLADELNTRFLPERVTEHIDTLRAAIADEMPRQFERWDGNFSVWTQQVNRMLNFAENRQPFLKQHVLTQFDLPAYHRLQLTNQTPERGYIHLNSLTIEQATWEGDYFEDVPVQLEAVARPGYVFSHWLGDDTSTANTIDFNVDQISQLEAVFVVSDINQVVINEINYNSSDQRSIGDWIELYNPNSTDVDLTGWSIRDDDDSHLFIFPAGTSLDAQGYLVIARSLEDFIVYYPDLPNVIGEFDFGLGSNGDAVRLYEPLGNLHDIVVYSPDEPWPTAADGQGPTLELLDPMLDNSLPENWANVHAYGSPGAINSEETLVKQATTIQSLRYYPNPSDGALTLEFNLLTAEQITIQLYAPDGRSVRVLSQEQFGVGLHTQTYELHGLPAGAYTVEMCINGGACLARTWVRVE